MKPNLRRPPFEDKLPSPVFFRTEKMPAHSTYPSLTHDWGEFVYSFTGITEVKAEDQHWLAPPQLGLWIPKGIEHVGFNHQEAVHCSVYIADELCGGLPQRLCAVEVSPLLRAILEHLRDSPGGQNGARDRLLLVLVDQLASCTVTGSYVPASKDPELDALLQLLRDHPGDPRSLTELAGTLNMSERTLMRRCVKELGMSLTEWRQRLKLVHALPMLRSGRTVESVALELGYATSSAFIRMFHRLTGISPRRFIASP